MPLAAELSRASGHVIDAGVIYAGKCPNQSLRRHLAHNTLGSLTLFFSLAALFRQAAKIGD